MARVKAELKKMLLQETFAGKQALALTILCDQAAKGRLNSP